METTARSARRRLLLRGRRNRERADFVGKLDGVETGAGLRPVLRRELDVAVARPMAKHAEEVAQVLLGVELVESRGGNERKQVAGAGSVVVAAHKQPRLTAGRDFSQLALRMVVVQSKPSVVEKAYERVLVAD